MFPFPDSMPSEDSYNDIKHDERLHVQQVIVIQHWPTACSGRV